MSWKRKLLATLPAPFEDGVFRLRQRWREAAAERAVAAFQPLDGRPHRLEKELVVSLTSFPPRFAQLDKTLKSLLMQSVRADRLILWIAVEDEAQLPRAVTDLTAHGLEIRLCDDTRSYKKIIPALHALPDANIVTVDDDLFYERDWLASLVGGVVGTESVIVCRRAHRPGWTGSHFAPYDSWQQDIATGGAIEPFLFPTGCGGVLYPPGSLAPQVFDQERFMALCPQADDIWLFMMGQFAGSRYRHVGDGFAQIPWAGSQEHSLLRTNRGENANDRQLEAMLEHYDARALIDARAKQVAGARRST